VDRVRRRFEATSDCTIHREQDSGADDQRSVPAGTHLWVAVKLDETRVLDGKTVSVVLFTIGDTWCWMPTDEFVRSTRELPQVG
jgi:hypothetical protein